MAATDPSDASPPPWSSEGYERDGGALGFPPAWFSHFFDGSIHDHLWFRGEFLGWWTKGFATPPLLTTSPTGTSAAQAGVLGEPGTTVLYGGSNLAGGFRPGERISFGSWLNGDQTWGLEGSYLQSTAKRPFSTPAPTSTPVLARPFFNSQTGVSDSQLVNYPGQQSGSFSAAAASEFQVAEFLCRGKSHSEPGMALDFLAGMRYQQLDDHLAANDALAFSNSQSGFPAGSTVQQQDRFDARNDFLGGEVGMSAALRWQRWTFDTVLKVGVGETRSRVAINGTTTTAIPGTTATVLPGGLLALPSNIGIHDSDQFSMSPDMNLTLGYDLSPQVRATVGYSLVYWNSVVRPGDQIDLNLDPRQFPPPVTTTATRPEFILHTSDYWAQGVTLGLDLRF